MTWDKVTKAASAVGVSLAGLLGGWDTMLKVAAALMVIDYVTGMLAGILGKSSKTPTGHISSEIAWKGLVKKCGELLAVAVGVLLDKLAMESIGYTTPIFRSGITVYIIATEGISVLENLGAIDVPLPGFVKKALEQLKEKSDAETENQTEE